MPKILDYQLLKSLLPYWGGNLRYQSDNPRKAEAGGVTPQMEAHGLVQRIADWPYSRFHRYVRLGILPDDWLSGDDAEIEAGEYRADPAN